MDHEITLASNIFTFFLCFIQILANMAVLIAYFTDHQLLANENIILLVSLAFIDFLYALLSVPYLVVLLIGWVPRGQIYNYNAYVILAFGSAPAALMKSGCTITTLIAVDRIFQLSCPLKYHTLNRRWFVLVFVIIVTTHCHSILYCGFIFALLMAVVDFVLVFLLTNIHAVLNCASFSCFVSKVFHTYWGLSNMVVNLLSCLLTTVVAVMLKRKKNVLRSGRNNILTWQVEDKWANRASFYILVVSAIFGVIPGAINGCVEFLHYNRLSGVAFFVGICASVSGVSHAFIFAMAHRGIRHRIFVMIELSFFRNKWSPSVAPKITVMPTMF